MAYFRSDLGERFENKPALLHGGMRNCEARFAHDAVAIQQHVDVDFPRAFCAQAQASHGGFDRQCQLQQLTWRLNGFNRRHAIQKPGLVREIDWLRLVQGRYRQQHSSCAQLSDRLAQVRGTIPKVRPERKICDFWHAL